MNVQQRILSIKPSFSCCQTEASTFHVRRCHTASATSHNRGPSFSRSKISLWGIWQAYARSVVLSTRLIKRIRASAVRIPPILVLPIPAVSVSVSSTMDRDGGDSFQSDYEGSIDTYIGTEQVPEDKVQISHRLPASNITFLALQLTPDTLYNCYVMHTGLFYHSTT